MKFVGDAHYDLELKYTGGHPSMYIGVQDIPWCLLTSTHCRSLYIQQVLLFFLFFAFTALILLKA